MTTTPLYKGLKASCNDGTKIKAWANRREIGNYLLKCPKLLHIKPKQHFPFRQLFIGIVIFFV
jgi:hypothetical protein